MIFDADVMVLKAEARPFMGRDGKQIPYARASVIDNVGNVFDASCGSDLVGSIEALRQQICIGTFDLSKGTSAQGKPSLKLKLVAIKLRPEPKK